MQNYFNIYWGKKCSKQKLLRKAKHTLYEVCSNSIWIAIIVVVHWVGCVCNQSWHVHTCLSNSRHKLQVAAFAQLAVVGHRSNTCVYVIAIFTMRESTEQHICIKFCFKIGKSAMEMHQLLQQAYSEDPMGFTQVYDWFLWFKEGRTSIESDPHSGQPSTSRNEEMIAKVRTIVHSDRKLTVWEIADDCGISVGSCDAILTDEMHMKCACVKFVLRLLTDDQRQQRQTITRDLFELSCEGVQFLKNIVTGDDSWVYGYDLETKQQSSQWKGPMSLWPKKGRQVAFFVSEGIVHHEYAPDGKTINKEFYVEVLRRFREPVRQKWPEKWRDGDWILHHDNAPAHTSHLVQQFLAKHGTAKLQQPPYSPDLATCDFFLFPRLKKALKGHRFQATEDIKRNSMKTLLDIPKEEFAKCFQQWQKRWANCVAVEGNYVEEN